jgi:hypothetical protein
LLVVIRESGVLKTYTGLEGARYSPDILVLTNEKLEGISFEFGKVEIIHDDYKGSTGFNYHINGMFSSGGFEIRELKFKILFRDSLQNVITSEILWLIHPDEFLMRPGDNVVFSTGQGWNSAYFESSKVLKVHQIALELDHIQRYTDAGSYPRPETVDFGWIGTKPGYLDFEIGIRSNDVGVLIESDRKMYQKLVLDIQNTGENACRELSVRLIYFDSTRNAIDNKQYDILTPDFPSLGQGKRLVYFMYPVFYEDPWDYPIPFDDFEVKVRMAR